MANTLTTEEVMKMPLQINNVNAVDDNGAVHYETVMTGRLLSTLNKSGVLRLEGNIRPEHQREYVGEKLSASNKTRVKIEKWTRELLAGKAIIGNLSLRVRSENPEVWYDSDERHENLTIYDGVLDTAVDSESRLRAILAACDNAFGDKVLDQRFAVRLWLLDDDESRHVGSNYNTRGDKVNDSTAKFAWAENGEQALAKRLVEGSEHLGIENIEVLSNSVSAKSAKLTAFNTIAKALETNWAGNPDHASAIDAQSAWLISAWDALVKVRPEFGKVPYSERLVLRKHSVSSTAVVIAGLLGAMSTMYTESIDPVTAFEKLRHVDGQPDVFANDNPIWERAGVVIRNLPDPNPKPGAKPKAEWTTRNSYASRDNAAKVLKTVMGLFGEDTQEAEVAAAP